MEVAGNTIPMNATNQEAGPEDFDVLDHGSVDPTLLDSLVEDLCVRELDNEDQCSSAAGSESCWGETESIGDDEAVEWGALPLSSSIDQGALAHPADTVDDFQACLPSPHVGRMGAARCESTAPRKRLRIRMGRESQATTVVGVESSDRHPASPIDPLGSASPEVRVERIGSQVVANTMGRVAMLATNVDDDLPTTVAAFNVRSSGGVFGRWRHRISDVRGCASASCRAQCDPGGTSFMR